MKRKIKENAIRLFSENGFVGTSIRNISDSVGITAAAVYAHFKSKEDLFLEVFAEGWREMSKGVVDSIKNQKNELNSELLFTIYKYHLNYYMNGKGATIFLLRNTMFPPSELKQKVTAIFYREMEATLEFIERIFEHKINKGLVRKMAITEHVNIFYRFINSFIFEITALDRPVTEEDIDKHWQCYWQWIKV